MAASKDKQTADNVPTEADLGLDEGYIGTKADPRPNSAYSLESGPDSPSAADSAVDVATARIDALEASTA